MNSLIKISLWILGISLFGFIWGYSYQSSHELEGIGSIFGYSSTTYKIASFAILFGIVGFLIGVGLLIGGFAKGKDTNVNVVYEQKKVERQSYCGSCGSEIPKGSSFCGNCGTKIN